MMKKLNTIRYFFKRKDVTKIQMYKVQMTKIQIYQVQMYKIQINKVQMSMLMIDHRQLLISQFLKFFLKDFKELMTINLILVHCSLILDYVIRYENIMLINDMKFEELTLMLVHTNLFSQTIRNLDYKIIFVSFNLYGSVYFLGLNIRARKMQPFVYPAFSLISNLDILHNMYLL
jgi:hypothetical protein